MDARCSRARRCLAAAGLLALFAPGAALAQKPAPPAVDTSPEGRRAREIKLQERQFLQAAAGHLRFQSQASRFVLTRSTHAGVLEVASDIVARHDATQTEMLRLLHARGMAPPIFTNEQLKVLKQMQKPQGGRLDRLYLEEVAVRSCQLEIAAHEKAATTLDDPALKAWSARQLPVLRAVLHKAERASPAGAVTTRSPQRAV